MSFFINHTKLYSGFSRTKKETKLDLKPKPVKKSMIFSINIYLQGTFSVKKGTLFAPFSALMTVEAALVLPFFLIGVFTLLNIMHILGAGQSILTTAARSIHSSSVHGYKENFAVDDILTDLVLNMGKSDLDFSTNFWRDGRY